MLQRFAAVTAPALAFALASAAQPASSPDLAIINARVYTGDAARPWAEAISVTGNRIAAVGTTAQIKAAGAPRKIDASGRLLIPGFNLAHAHPRPLPQQPKGDGPPAVGDDPTVRAGIPR